MVHQIRSIPVRATYLLRYKVLREPSDTPAHPDDPGNGDNLHIGADRNFLPDDDINSLADRVARPGDEQALHFGYFEKSADSPLGVISLYPQDQQEQYSTSTWRIRGMAVELSQQQQGIGAALLDHAESYLETHYPLRSIWCNARKPAKGFYEKYGYKITDVVEITFPYTGKSYRMEKQFRI